MTLLEYRHTKTVNMHDRFILNSMDVAGEVDDDVYNYKGGVDESGARS